MGVITYDSNNSGGDWWLSDDDWKALEAAGWVVHWGGRKYGEDSLTPTEKTGKEWLGALAVSCAKDGFDSARQGIEEWTSITGQDPLDMGCPCCGNPHTFQFYPDGLSGGYVYHSADYGDARGSW